MVLPFSLNAEHHLPVAPAPTQKNVLLEAARLSARNVPPPHCLVEWFSVLPVHVCMLYRAQISSDCLLRQTFML
jgi:hypothetical protein